MNGDWFPGWEQAPRRRNSRRYEEDQEFGRRKHGRRASQGDDGDYYGRDYTDSGWHDVRHTDPRGATDPYGGADPYQGPDPYGRTDPRGYYEPYAGEAQYQREPGYPADDGYGRGGYGGDDDYAEPGWDRSQQGYDQGYDSHDQGQYQDESTDWDAHPGQYDEYGQSQPAYPAADRYATADDDRAGWGAGGVGSRDYDQVSRRYRGDAGHDRPAGGRRSRRDMEVEEDRHSAFFGGFSGEENGRYRPPRRRRGISAGWIALIIILAIIGGIGYTGYHFYSEYQLKHRSFAGPGHGSVTITVNPGDSGDTIAAQLVDKGVVGSIDSWASFMGTQPNASALQPGEYKLELQMSNAEAWARLTSPKFRVSPHVTIPDGLPLAKILPLLAKESGKPLSQFQSAIKQTSQLGLPAYANGNAEGYLFPATYDIQPGKTTALDILKLAVHQFNLQAAALHLAAGAHRTGFTEAHIITGASLLEAEVSPKYYADVAEVIDNRLNSGMDLGLDSTIAYATGKYIYNLTASDLHVNSPYNTFTHPGLPPGPIDSPSAAAIQAFLNPATGHNWTYFVTVNKQGLTLFTNSSAQFNIWSQEAKRNGV